MRYAEIEPPPDLRDLVRCLWILEAAGTTRPPVERILPDGSPEIVVHFGDPFSSVDARGVRHVQPRALVVGQLTRALLLAPSRRAGVLGVRLAPHAAAELVGDASELTDAAVAAADAWGAAADTLADQVASARSDEERAGAAFAWLRARRLRRAEDVVISHALHRLSATRGRLRVRDLARECAISPRQLERRMLVRVGLSPKKLARLARFRAATALLRSAPRPDLAAVAAECGYADQPHFTREFGDFAGIAPSAWLGEQRVLDDLFSDAESATA